MSNRLDFIYSESWRRELSIGIYIYEPSPEGGVGWGVPRCGYSFLGGVSSSNFLGHSHGILNISLAL